MVRRLVDKADFERLLANRARWRSAHFALHHVPGEVVAAASRVAAGRSEELSTSHAPGCAQPVDDFAQSLWLGCVVPKRHARRAVTRSLLKRQMRCAIERHAGWLPPGHWLVRLHAGFPVAQFVSARSTALALAIRTELDALLGRARERSHARA